MASRRLVIDASIARAGGGEGAAHPTSRRCRDFLSKMLDVCDSFVMSKAISGEWRRHQSNFARRWRVSMVARKKLFLVNPSTNDGLREAIRQEAASRNELTEMLKDAHLIEAAMAADGIVVSLDEEARGFFSRIAGGVGVLRVIRWLNPVDAEEEALAWLEGRMDLARKWLL